MFRSAFGHMSMIDLVVRPCSGLPLVSFCLALVGAVLSFAPVSVQLLWARAPCLCLCGVGWWFGLVWLFPLGWVEGSFRRP